ncbi:hypothetical protein [Chitinophaga silvisoli]|nr:hypothetical protein [Chitinophaga silvisoli]
MDIKNSIKLFVETLKERPHMLLLGNPDFNTYKVFLDGFLLGLESAYDTRIMLDMTFWFQRKLKIEAKYHWTDMIPIYYKGKTDDELIVILLQTLSDYVEEKL